MLRSLVRIMRSVGCAIAMSLSVKYNASKNWSSCSMFGLVGLHIFRTLVSLHFFTSIPVASYVLQTAYKFFF